MKFYRKAQNSSTLIGNYLRSTWIKINKEVIIIAKSKVTKLKDDFVYEKNKWNSKSF